MRLEGLEHASETEQAIAFFHWLRLFSRMAMGGMIQAWEGDDGREKYLTDAHKNLFVYGWGYCDTTASRRSIASATSSSALRTIARCQRFLRTSPISFQPRVSIPIAV